MQGRAAPVHIFPNADATRKQAPTREHLDDVLQRHAPLHSHGVGGGQRGAQALHQLEGAAIRQGVGVQHAVGVRRQTGVVGWRAA